MASKANLDRITVSVGDISAAAAQIGNTVRRTPLIAAADLTARAGQRVHLKLENLQHTGSFKIRGATNAVLQLQPAQQQAGVVAVSTGNHGRGVAAAAKEAGVGCTVCMSSLVPDNKVAAVRALGAQVEIVGNSQDDADLRADELEAAGVTRLPPFDHGDVIAGQGTIALELLEQNPGLQEVVVPLSGGGLISGIAIAAKAIKPGIRIIGVTMDRGPAMMLSQQAGHPVQVEEEASLADSLGGGIGLQNAHTFAIVRHLVDDMILVSEDEIARAIAYLYWHAGQIVEGGAAVGAAALLAGKYQPKGVTALVISGSNIDPSRHRQLVMSHRELD